MAKDTAERIRTAAIESFSRAYYDVVSVAQICRTAGISNGAFYRYYDGKEAIFRDLLDEFLTRFAADLAAIHEPTPAERPRRFIEVVSGVVRRYAGQVAVFCEGQYRNPEYERRLREIYLQTLEYVFGRSEWCFRSQTNRWVYRSTSHTGAPRTDRQRR